MTTPPTDRPTTLTQEAKIDLTLSYDPETGRTGRDAMVAALALLATLGDLPHKVTLTIPLDPTRPPREAEAALASLLRGVDPLIGVRLKTTSVAGVLRTRDVSTRPLDGPLRGTWRDGTVTFVVADDNAGGASE